MGTYSMGLSRFSWDSLDNMQVENGALAAVFLSQSKSKSLQGHFVGRKRNCPPKAFSRQGKIFSFRGTVAVSAVDYFIQRSSQS